MTLPRNVRYADLRCCDVQGIGRATALRFAKDGYNVVIVARPSTFLEKSERDVRDLQAAYRTFRDCVAVPCDITNEDDVQRLVQTVQNRFDTVDVVVSNAGKSQTGENLDMASCTQDRTLKPS